VSDPLDPDVLGNLSGLLGGRSRLGRLAVLAGWITDDQLRDAAAESRSSGRPVEDVLAARGLLDAAKLADLRAQDERDELPAEIPDGARRVGPYVLARELGGGQAGVVWKAWDVRLRRWVALKLAREASAFPRERFLREARAAAKLRHPSLVEALEVGRDGDRDYLVLTYVEGPTADLARLELREAVALVAGIAGAVQTLHDAGILHRDVKPQNILVDERGRGHLADFGLARDRAEPSLTREGTLMGTPLYMAPEQATGKPEDVAEAADVYGLGATLYHLAVGRPPFAGAEALDVLLRKLAVERPAPPRSIHPAFPADLEAVLLRALEKDPRDRYPTASAFAEDLRRWLAGESVSAKPAGPVALAARRLRRRPLLLAAGLVAAITAVLAVRHLSREAAYARLFQSGAELWARGAPAEAAGRFEEAAAYAPSKPEPRLMRARCLAAQGRDPLPDLSEALRRDPGHGPSLLERAKHLLAVRARLQQPPAARSSGGRVRFGLPERETPEGAELRERAAQDLALARQSGGLAPGETDVLDGGLAFAARRWSDAADALDRAVKRNPRDPASWRLLGAARWLSGDFAAAEVAFTEALRFGLDPALHRARGDARLALGRAAEALRDYESDPDDASTLCNRAVALQLLGRAEEAVAVGDRAVARAPTLARAWNNRGAAKAETLDFAGAEADFEKALELREFYPEAYFNLGNVLQLRGQDDEALRQYGLALEIDPDYAEARLQRGRLRRKKGDLDGALADLDAAVKGGDADAFYELALAKSDRGDRAGAVDAIRSALAGAPADWPLRAKSERLLKDWSR
jgi:serine/threonine-protein kinase